MSRDDDDDDGDNYDNLRNNVYCALCDESEGRAKKCPRYEAFQTKKLKKYYCLLFLCYYSYEKVLAVLSLE